MNPQRRLPTARGTALDSINTPYGCPRIEDIGDASRPHRNRIALDAISAIRGSRRGLLTRSRVGWLILMLGVVSSSLLAQQKAPPPLKTCR